MYRTRHKNSEFCCENKWEILWADILAETQPKKHLPKEGNPDLPNIFSLTIKIKHIYINDQRYFRADMTTTSFLDIRWMGKIDSFGSH